MKPESISILSTHLISCTPELLAHVHESMWGEPPSASPDPDAQYRLSVATDLLDGLRLVVIQVTPPHSQPDWRSFIHPDPDSVRDNWQVPWDEQLIDSARGIWAFFLHCVNHNHPLRTSFGDLTLPVPTPLPPHLATKQYEHPG